MKILDFPGSRVIGPPRQWDQELDGSCGQIFVADHIDVQSGVNFQYTFYQPTPEDLVALQAGGVLRLGIAGSVHPVFNFGVLKDALAKHVGFRPVWDLGGPHG